MVKYMILRLWLKRQEELIEDFLSPFEVAEDAYVIEDTEKSE